MSNSFVLHSSFIVFVLGKISRDVLLSHTMPAFSGERMYLSGNFQVSSMYHKYPSWSSTKRSVVVFGKNMLIEKLV